jgi:aminopeptidase
MSLGEWADFLAAACLLDQPDPVRAWQAQSARQQRLCDFLHGAKELRFTTPGGTDLTVGVAGRMWVNSDGRANLPDGEVFTGPIEDATAGVVRLSFPARLGPVEVHGACLHFRGGRVVEATATRGQEVLESFLALDAGAAVLGEIALGCNAAVTRPTGSPLVDEKIGGTFHLALGASYPATGGRNRSAVHWDLVCDLRQGGRVEVDGRVLTWERESDRGWEHHP